MINQAEQTLFRLSMLDTQQQRISYQMSTGEILQNGSDDSKLYARQIYVDDKIKMYESIKTQIDRTTAQNNIADSSISEFKTNMEYIKSELIKANTDTTTPEGKKAIATNIAGIKETLLDLANTQVEGEFIFAGSDSSIRPFTKDASGDVVYNGDNLYKKVIVDDGSYREKGVNGLDLIYYPTSTAYRTDPLEFQATDRIIDQDGNEWQIDTVANQLRKLDEDGNVITPSVPDINTINFTSDGATIPTYTATMPDIAGTKFEAKRNIFDMIDTMVNALNGLDANNDPIDSTTVKEVLGYSLSEMDKAYDGVNATHAELGGKNKVFEISAERVSSKLTQYNVLSLEIGAADLAKVAVEAKALELTYTALYSTINKTNELSLVNFLS